MRNTTLRYGTPLSHQAQPPTFLTNGLPSAHSQRFAAVIMRVREPKTTALIFKSGKVVVTGAKSEQQAREAARKYARIIQKIGFDNAKFKDFKIQARRNPSLTRPLRRARLASLLSSACPHLRPLRVALIDPHLDGPLVPQNIVGSADVKFPIRLEGIMYKHSLYSSVSSRPASPYRPMPLILRLCASIPTHSPRL